MCELACCDDEWISQLARRQARRLAGIARSEGVNAIDALDVVQESFSTLLGRPDAVTLCTRPDDAARLLSAIVRNAARNWRRRHHHARPHIDVDDVALAAPQPRADEAIDQKAAAAQLVGCMAKLDDVHRHIVTLRVLEELSGDEAAEALGLKVNHVAVLLHRARKELERCMG